MTASRMCLARLLATTLAALFIATTASPSRAELVLTVENSMASAGGTGSFDVLLSDTGGSYQVAGFSVELSVASGSGVEFTGVDVNTTLAPYIFGTLQNPPLSFNSFPTTDFIASDSPNSAPGYVTLNAGDMFGLEHVSYSVAAGTVGPIIVSIDGINTTTEINSLTSILPFTPNNGNITLGSAVPEPSSFVLIGIGALGLAKYARTRSRPA